MKNDIYPTIDSVLVRSAIVEAWTVADVTRSLKNIEDAVRKVEVGMAKETSDFLSSSQQKRQLADIQKLMKKLSEQLNRILGASF
jgi:hypothetical protein